MGEYERHAQQARVGARAAYNDWKDPKEEKLSVAFRKALLRRDRSDPEKFFNEAGESSKRPSS
jgi:hypothetical protein